MPTSKQLKKGSKQMMKNAAFKRSTAYMVNLAQLDGEGTFPCPRCATTISPDDESEENYKIVETKVVNQKLVELGISCRTCGALIRLTGFQQTLEGLTTE